MRLDRLLILALAAPLLPLAACGGGGPDGAVRVDSAGIALVTNAAEDQPLGWRFEPDFTLGGEDFYRLSRYTVGVDGSGRIFVLDADGKRVLRYGPSGELETTLGRPGKGPGELEWPIGLAVSDDGTARVTDLGRGVVVAWSPAGVARDDGSVSPGNERSHVGPWGAFRETTEYGGEGTVERLVYVPASGSDTVVLARVMSQGRAIQLESCGMGFSGMPPVFAPDIRWDGAGGVVAVSDGPAYDVALYDGGAPAMRVRRDVAPPAATPELAVAEIGEGMRVMTTGGERVCDSEEVVEQRGMAERMPLIERLTVEPGGRLWVERFVPGDDPGAIDVFEADGEYLGTLPAGTPFPLMFDPSGRALIEVRDEMDVERLQVGRFVEAAGREG